jgi:protein-S-isoprenylcysteine O-methyltransferase Ste14
LILAFSEKFIALNSRGKENVLLAAALVPPVLARIHAEERLLQSQFGDVLVAYRTGTSRLIPGIY